jgi:hypothetical protein
MTDRAARIEALEWVTGCLNTELPQRHEATLRAMLCELRAPADPYAHLKCDHGAQCLAQGFGIRHDADCPMNHLEYRRKPCPDCPDCVDGVMTLWDGGDKYSYAPCDTCKPDTGRG